MKRPVVLLILVSAAASAPGCGSGSVARTATSAGAGPFRIVPRELTQALADAGVSARTVAGAPTRGIQNHAHIPVRRLRTTGGTVVDAFFFRSSERALRGLPGLGGKGRRIKRLNVVSIVRRRGDDVGAVVGGLRHVGADIGP